MKNGDELPDDVIELILINLPYKSLVRFKGVSRRWKYIICQPRFIYGRYLNNKVHDNSSSSFIVARSRLGPENIRYFSHLSVSYKDGKLTSSDVESFTIPSNMGDALASLLIKSAGFGVYCLFNMRTRKVSLWNPSIREVKVLPLLPPPSHEDDIYVYGFAHIEYINNKFSYKVGMIRHMLDEADGVFNLNIDVYSSLDNLWKPSRHSCRLICSGDLCSGNGWLYSGIVLNGKFNFLNWMSEEDVHIISFDLFTEAFERLEIPNPLPSDSNAAHSILTSMDDKFLCLVIYRGDYDEPQWAEVWIMYEYGKAKSWRKVSTVGPVSDPALVDIIGVNNQVGGMFFQGFEHGEGLFFCPFGSEKAETLLPVKSRCFEMMLMVDYRESLISFDGISDQRVKFSK